jgi:hypothetical protein
MLDCLYTNQAPAPRTIDLKVKLNGARAETFALLIDFSFYKYIYLLPYELFFSLIVFVHQ